MSFVRPELVERLRPWSETLLWGAVAGLGLLFLGQGVQAGALLPLMVGLLLMGGGGIFLVAALKRRPLQGQAADEGVVQVQEARIGYFGPRGGGFVDLGAIERVDMVTDGQRAAWWLQDAEGVPLRIPVGARGAERIYDALAAAVPLDEEALKAALATRQPARFPLWVRTGAEGEAFRRLR
jgi:hypothetical protein